MWARVAHTMGWAACGPPAGPRQRCYIAMGNGSTPMKSPPARASEPGTPDGFLDILDVCDAETAHWYQLSLEERWVESVRLWETYRALGGSLDPEPDTQSPFFDPGAWRSGTADRGQACILYGAQEFVGISTSSSCSHRLTSTACGRSSPISTPRSRRVSPRVRPVRRRALSASNQVQDARGRTAVRRHGGRAVCVRRPALLPPSPPRHRLTASPTTRSPPSAA